jgi:hypothetical protein
MPSDDLYRRWRAFQAGERKPAAEPSAPSPAPLRFERWSEVAGLPEGWRLLDLETSALRGGFAFLGGVAAPVGGRLRVVQWVLGDLPGEAALLRALAAELDGCECLVTYNGRSFDWPLLRDRARLHGVTPWPEPPHRDLLHEARAVWGPRLGRVALGELEGRLLGRPPRRDDPGGAAMPGLYRAYLAGDQGALELVLGHNAADLVALAALAARCRALDRGDWRGTEPPELLGLAGWRWRRGDRAGSADALSAWLGAVGSPSRTEALRGAELCRRLGRWEDAARLWEEAAAGPFGSVEAAVRLAVHHERRRRDPAAALAVIEAAMARPWLGPDRRAALAARRDRLQRRLAAGHTRQPASTAGMPARSVSRARSDCTARR